jgi:hypothetical protein
MRRPFGMSDLTARGAGAMRGLVGFVVTGAVSSVLLVSTMASAQDIPLRAITVGPNVQVSAAYPDVTQSEGLIAADPGSADQLLGCTMMWPDSSASWVTVAYHSADGGKSWKPTLRTRAEDWAMDPTCTYGPDGWAYMVTAPRYSRQGLGETMTLWRSRDGGATWDSSGTMASVDRDYLSVDHTQGRFRGRIYVHGVSSTRLVDGSLGGAKFTLFASSDGGRTFHSVARVTPANQDISINGNSVVLADGTWVGVFGEMRPEGHVSRPHDTSGEPNASLRVIRSTDGGKTLEPATTIDDLYFWWQTWNGSRVPYIAADPGSKEFGDRLYVVWPDDRSGHLTIRFAYSTDNGRSWSRSVVVSEEESNDLRSPRDQLMPMIAVNRDGVVGIAWQDRRDAEDNLGWSVRFRASYDGGETFTPSVRVSERDAAFGPAVKWPVIQFVTGGGSHYPSTGPLNIDLSLGWSQYTGGHTSGMVADRNGVFHPYWVDNRTGVHQVWTAPVSVRGQAARYGVPAWSGLVDVSAKVTLEASETRFDRASNTLTASIRLHNTSSDTILAPIKLRVVRLESDAGTVELSNPVTGGLREGAMFGIQDALGVGGLAPGARSEAQALSFHLTRLRPGVLGENYKFSLVKASAQVLAGGVKPSRTATNAGADRSRE